MTAGGFELRQEDLDREAARFGAADDQVRRDHAISHILGAISSHLRQDVIFFGGTALSRTHLVHARLSEDIDLIARGKRSQIANRLVSAINMALLRPYGRLSWSPSLTTHDVEPAIIETATGLSIRVQLLDKHGYQPWPTELRDIEQRYQDAPPATLIVPTIESFVGWKTTAWHMRGASRDLYDLWALAQAGAITAKAADLFAKHGTTGNRPSEFIFAKAPSQEQWQASLSGQTRLEVTAAEALAVVRNAWASALGENWPS
ncbi:MAG: nucleotidyl transferase AbiEii/AbiGii toxin family protein [Mycobacteriaceae bacterium]|nr:nucleotidyl transferase AbiEii/AbiGii toxin family protein [Mycobacteriaceae bacterium]